MKRQGELVHVQFKILFFLFNYYIIINIQKIKRKKDEQTVTRKRFEEIRQGVTSKEGKTHLSINHMYQIVAHLCHFLLREVISPSGRFFDGDSELGMKHRTLCKWGGSKRPYEPERERERERARENYDIDYV